MKNAHRMYDSLTVSESFPEITRLNFAIRILKSHLI